MKKNNRENTVCTTYVVKRLTNRENEDVNLQETIRTR